MRRWLLLLVACATACSSGDPQPPTTTTSVLDPSAYDLTTTSTSPSFDIPAVIELPYVQHVLEAIYHMDGEAARYAYAKKIIDAEVYQRLEAIYGGQALDASKQVLGENAAQGFVKFAAPPGDPKVRATDIIDATTRCVVVRADLDFGPYYREERPRGPQLFIQLARADVLPENPTGWGVRFHGMPDADQNLKVCQ